jgi:hypothetical protein
MVTLHERSRQVSFCLTDETAVRGSCIVGGLFQSRSIPRLA